MMKQGMKYGVFSILFLLLAICSLFAQNTRFGNEWINFSNTYYSIPVSQNGIYKVTYEAMQSAGIPVATIPPSNFQLWHRGKQLAIQTVNSNSNAFSPGDYILFYGIKNDGWQDSSLYISPSMQPHKLLSLFNDTTKFFLTWANGFSKRMAVNNNPALTNQLETYHLNEELIIYSNEYSNGTASDLDPRNSFWEPAEGWCSSKYDINSAVKPSFTLNSMIPGSFNISGVLFGRNASANSIQINEITQASNPQGLGNVSFDGNSSSKFSFDFSISSTVGSINLGLAQQNSGALFSIGYLKLSYPQAFDMMGQSSKVFNLLPNASNFSSIKVSNVPANALVFDITDYSNVVAINSVQTGPTELTFSVQNTSVQRKILVTNSTIQPNLNPSPFRSFTSTSKTFVILTHKALMKGYGASSNVVKDYAAYRYSTLGGGYDTLVVDVEQVYDQFGYGESNPLAIRKFCDYLTQSPSIKPAFLLIIGKGIDVSNYNSRFNPSALLQPNLVPTFGSPGSDILFTAGLDNAYLHEPAIPTGRI
ncbi:MAG: hypothetical protein K2Q22_06940, partial [Cytophagales bacterium]|nr:hypothetical protein [Cytophagales bacterium]